MTTLQIIAIVAAVLCVARLFAKFVRIVRLGAPNDLSEKSGDTGKGILYSNTKAMMPQNKESAFLHIPSYASGMLFHIGIFSSLLIFLLSFFPFFNRWIEEGDVIHYIIAILLGVTSICGYILLVKRIVSQDLRSLSNADDYISNACTSTFQLATVLYLCLHSTGITSLYYIICTILFLYLPLGKLRHVVYYFAARYHLGFFYGWRNVWPKNEK